MGEVSAPSASSGKAITLSSSKTWMVGWSSRPGLAVAVAVVVVLGSLGLVADLSTTGGAGSAVAHSSLSAGVAPATAVHGAPSPSLTGIAKVLAVEDELRAMGVSPATVHLPNFAGAVTDTAQPIQPSYTQAPAPMGVADIGLENRSGALVPYALNTTSVAGTVNITNLQSLYVDGDGPDTYGIQLNSVVNGVTIFGNSSYEFWSQNYIGYTVSTQQLVFGDEVWNFSSPSGVFPTSSVYGFSPNGTFADFPALYQGYGPSITIGYPFTLTLYLNTSTIADRPALYFNYTVSNNTFRQSSSFDYLIFNSSAGTPTHAAATPYYQADGYHYDPIGLINDMEIDILGNDNGDTTAFLAADATISLQVLERVRARDERGALGLQRRSGDRRNRGRSARLLERRSEPDRFGSIGSRAGRRAMELLGPTRGRGRHGHGASRGELLVPLREHRHHGGR